MSNLNYSHRNLIDLKSNPAFIDWISTIEERLESIRRQLEVSGKETLIIRNEDGSAKNFVFGHDYLQGAVAELRYVLTLADIQDRDLLIEVEQEGD